MREGREQEQRYGTIGKNQESKRERERERERERQRGRGREMKQLREERK